MKHEVFVFSKTNYADSKDKDDCIEVGKPYMLIKKEVKNEIINLGDRVGDPKETSFFYALDDNLIPDTNKIFVVSTDWWSTEASYKNARIMGEIQSNIVYNEIEIAPDY